MSTVPLFLSFIAYQSKQGDLFNTFIRHSPSLCFLLSHRPSTGPKVPHGAYVMWSEPLLPLVSCFLSKHKSV